MNKTEWPPIAFGTVFWKEVGDKADWITRIESFLQQNIQLDDYGSGISAIRFVSVAVMPSNKRHEEYIKYFRKYKELGACRRSADEARARKYCSGQGVEEGT